MNTPRNKPHIYFEGGSWHTILPSGFDMQRRIREVTQASYWTHAKNYFNDIARQGFSPAPDSGRVWETHNGHAGTGG